jgi:DNA invertase Pin-like site-specific DNA recombinase
MVRNSASPKPAQSGSTRCANYTRKSSEDGLEQEFNSLDAQREACLAYITSQRHEAGFTRPSNSRLRSAARIALARRLKAGYCATPKSIN